MNIRGVPISSVIPSLYNTCLHNSKKKKGSIWAFPLLPQNWEDSWTARSEDNLPRNPSKEVSSVVYVTISILFLSQLSLSKSSNVKKKSTQSSRTLFQSLDHPHSQLSQQLLWSMPQQISSLDHHVMKSSGEVRLPKGILKETTFNLRHILLLSVVWTVWSDEAGEFTL